jgi:c(7)-type cytochrome triheme protein
LQWPQTLSRAGRWLATAGLTVCTLAGSAPVWSPLARDGVHDPRNPGLAQLQEPAEALAGLPRDTAGNMVRWMQALERGLITPRSSLQAGRAELQAPRHDSEIIIARNGSMPAVRFPHRPHNEWLDCSNCHDQLFKARAGANTFRMSAILEGEQCGLCHGAVSFPLTECNRCHSVPNASLPRASAR